MALTYEPIASTTLGTSAATVSFSAIPQSFTDLVVAISGGNSATLDLYIKLGNGSIDSGSNYSATTLYAGVSPASTRFSNSSSGTWVGYPQGVSGLWTLIAHVMSYSNTNVYKSILSAHTENDNAVYRTVGLWRSTNAVDNLQIYMASANMTSGTTVSLYGIKAA